MPSAATTSGTGLARTEDFGKLLLRVTLGVLILLHGIAKIQGGVDGIVGIVGKAGLPPAIGYLVYAGEVLAPVLMVIGLFTRLAAVIVAINMVAAILLVHAGEIMLLSNTGGWAIELQGMYLLSALAVALLGAGRFSVGGVTGRWN